MKKINKELAYSMLIKLCWITIIICNILKFFGSNKFEIPIFNNEPSLLVMMLINGPLYCINGYCFSLILCKRKLKLKETIIIILINIPIYFVSNFYNLLILKMILELISYVLIGLWLNKDKLYKQILESIAILGLFTVYQLLTLLYKNIPIAIQPVGFIEDKILQVDYYILIILRILKSFKRGGYIYYEWWIKFLAIFSKRKRIEKSLQQNQKNVQEIEFGYKLFIVLLSITQLFVVGVACYFINGVIFEYIAIFISFVMMRKVFGNSYHSDSIIKCTTLAIVVYVTATRLSLPLWLSALCNVMIGCLVAYMMYVMYYYIKFTNTAGITVYKGMKKEDLNSLCDLYQVEEIDKIILTEYYVNRKRLDNIAFKVNYSVDNVKKRKANVLKLFRESK